MFARRSPQFAQAARLDEILVHAGSNQLPQDLKTRKTQGCHGGFYIHTAYHSDSSIDPRTLIADISVCLLLRPVRAQLRRRDVVDTKKWDFKVDERFLALTRETRRQQDSDMR